MSAMTLSSVLNASSVWVPGPLSPVVISGSGTSWTLNYAPGNITGVSGTLGGALYMRAGFPTFDLSGYSGAICQNI